jgi:hypothetical protein
VALSDIGNVAREKKEADYLYASTVRDRVGDAILACGYQAVWGWGEMAQDRRRSGLWAVRVESKGSTGFRMGAKGRTPLSNEAGPNEEGKQIKTEETPIESRGWEESRLSRCDSDVTLLVVTPPYRPSDT